ncbi:hypothetical protein ACTFIZ_002701 [Dictyostelium cf. discoideum]
MIEKRTIYFFLSLFISFLIFKTNALNLVSTEKDCLLSLYEKIGYTNPNNDEDLCSIIPNIKCNGDKVDELSFTQNNIQVINPSDLYCFLGLSKVTLNNFFLSGDFLTNDPFSNNNVSLSLIGSTNGFKIDKKISSEITYLSIDINQITTVDPILMSYFISIKILNIKGITGQITFGSETSDNEEIKLVGNGITSSSRINLSNYSKLKILNIETLADFKISDGNFQFINAPSSLYNFKLKGSTFTNLVSAFSVLNKVGSIGISNNLISTTLPNTHQLTISPSLNVDLSNNQLTGTISQDYCSIGKINFSNNKLTGTIPNCFTCFMDSTMILNFNGNTFTGLKEVTTYCNEIIPKLRYVKESNKIYLEGTNLGFNENIVSNPVLTWKMQTPSKEFIADTISTYPDSQLFTVNFPIAKASFTIRLVEATPVITNIIVSASKVLTIQGSDFSNHLSLTNVKLRKKDTTTDITCTINSSTFNKIECTCSSLVFSSTDIYTLTVTSNQLTKDIKTKFSGATTISGSSCVNNCFSRGTCLFDGTCDCIANSINSDCSECINNHYGPTCSLTCPIGSNGKICSGYTCFTNNVTCSCIEDQASGNACQNKVCPGSCSGHGTCNTATGVCSCSTDYYGTDCSKKPCPKAPNGYECSGNVNGKCNDNGICTCNSVYFGSDCSSIPCPKSNQKECGGNGACNYATGVCSCSTDYYGTDCSKKRCPKAPNGYECSGNVNGKCNDDGTCTCNSVYFGSDCSSIPCPKSNQKECGGNGNCKYSTGTCECNPGFYETNCSRKHCPIGANNYECSGYLNGKCNDNGICSCIEPYYGDDCGFSPCPTSTSQKCSGNGNCNLVTGTCSCTPGFYEADCSKKHCPSGTNGLECSGNVNGVCNNNGTCTCKTPYIGNNCGIIPCPTSNLESCSGNGNCNNVTGVCSCNTDYYEVDCSKKLCPSGSNGFECSGNTNGKCDSLSGQCECNSNRQGIDCGTGFYQCPIYLDQLCNGKPCNNQTGICSCDQGVTLPDCSGVACPSTCLNGGLCDIKIGQCKCGPYWTGDYCNVPLHYITSIEPCSTKGGKVSFYGWFGDVHGQISISIGAKRCNNIVSTNNTITCDIESGTGLKDVLLLQNGVSVLAKNLFRYLNTEESISCLNDCSDNGVCSKTDGICKCDIEKIGFDCSARKPQDLITSSPIPSSSSSSSDNSTLEIVPISITNIDFKSGEILISNEETSFTILLDSLVELNYNGDVVKTTILRNKWIGSLDSDTEKYSFSQPVSSYNGTSGKIQFDVEVVRDDIKQYPFAGLNLPLDKDGIEIVVNITNYQFLSGLNTLQLRFNTFANNVINSEDSDSSTINYDNGCNEREAEIDTSNIDPSKTLNYISIKKNSKVLFGRFINIAISDSRQTFITSEIIEENTNSSAITIGVNLPHCVDSCFIDPQFTLSPDYSTYKFSCVVIIVPPSRVWIVVIAVVIPTIIVSVALYFGIRYYKKNRYSIKLYTMKKSSAIKKKITLKKVNK